MWVGYREPGRIYSVWFKGTRGKNSVEQGFAIGIWIKAVGIGYLGQWAHGGRSGRKIRMIWEKCGEMWGKVWEKCVNGYIAGFN